MFSVQGHGFHDSIDRMGSVCRNLEITCEVFEEPNVKETRTGATNLWHKVKLRIQEAQVDPGNLAEGK